MPLVTFLLLATPPTQAPAARKAPAAEAVVPLEGSAIVLPVLPRSAAGAWVDYGPVHGRIQEAGRDLERHLAELYARPEVGTSLKGLTVPDSWVAEGRRWVAILQDPQHGRLEKDFLDTWKGWQAALVEGKLAQAPKGGLPSVKAPSPRYQAAKDGAARIIQQRALDPLEKDRLDASFNEEDRDLYKDLTDAMSREERKVHDGMEASVKAGRKTLAVASSIIPDLAAFWDPLVEHLNGQAKALASLEQLAQASPGGPLSALRLQARIAYLERFRRALWYCDLVWAQVASKPLPASPRPLRPQA
jgi:hypothetical protein